MSENDLTPRVLAGLALGEDPAGFMSFRLMPDNSVVVVDHAGRKFILTQAELRRVEDEITARRLHARGRALVEDLKVASMPEGAPKVSTAGKKPAGKKSAAKTVARPAPKPQATPV
jgi:hypothetical protein